MGRVWLLWLIILIASVIAVVIFLLHKAPLAFRRHRVAKLMPRLVAACHSITPVRNRPGVIEAFISSTLHSEALMLTILFQPVLAA